MEIIYATDDNFKDLISDYVLVDFFATWCGPCKMLGPVLENVKDQIKIVKVDVDKCPKIAQEYDVMSVPTVFIMKQGKVLSSHVGYAPEPIITKWINENR